MNMKMRSLETSLFTLSGFLATTAHMFAQGSLIPPGAPAATMKSLDQIEPRVPISYVDYYIGSPGSYYVTTNLIGGPSGVPNAPGPWGIYIASDNVTVDLNGFTLQGVPGSFSGVYIYGSHTNIVVRNGIVTGWGQNGITWNYPSSPPQNVVLKNLTVSANTVNGIVTANGYIVSDCTVQNNGGTGILVDGNGSQIVGNTLFGNNAAFTSTSCGILLEGSNNRVEGNHITGHASGYGIEYDFSNGTNNVIIKNSVVGNSPNNYSPGGGGNNDVGPIGTAASSTSPWANISK
jgi:parallel beta-helix repeat protein